MKLTGTLFDHGHRKLHMIRISQGTRNVLELWRVLTVQVFPRSCCYSDKEEWVEQRTKYCTKSLPIRFNSAHENDLLKMNAKVYYF